MANDANRLFLNQIIPMGAKIEALQHEVRLVNDRLQAIEFQLAALQQGDPNAKFDARLKSVEGQVSDIGSLLKQCVGELQSA